MIDEAIVLAAGKSTRMESQKNKVLENLAGRPMIHYVLDTVAELGIMAPIVVVGHQADEVTAQAKAYQGVLSPIFVTQENPAGGTGDAVNAARDFLAGEFVAVLYGDMPFIRAETLYGLAEALGQDAVMGMVTTPIEPTSHFGRVLRSAHGDVKAIVEWKNANDEERQIAEGNLGVYVFRTQWLLAALPSLKQNPVTHEVYLTDLVDIAITGKQRVVAIPLTNEDEATGVNTRDELLRAEVVAGKQ